MLPTKVIKTRHTADVVELVLESGEKGETLVKMSVTAAAQSIELGDYIEVYEDHILWTSNLVGATLAGYKIILNEPPIHSGMFLPLGDVICPNCILGLLYQVAEAFRRKKLIPEGRDDGDIGVTYMVTINPVAETVRCVRIIDKTEHIFTFAELGLGSIEQRCFTDPEPSGS